MSLLSQLSVPTAVVYDEKNMNGEKDKKYVCSPNLPDKIWKPSPKEMKLFDIRGLQLNHGAKEFVPKVKYDEV